MKLASWRMKNRENPIILNMQPETQMRQLTITVLTLLGMSGFAFAQEATFQTKSLTPETVLVAARAAMESCRKQGFQVSVAVVNRAGLTQVLFRGSLAHTPWKLRSTRPGPAATSVRPHLRWPRKLSRISLWAGCATFPGDGSQRRPSHRGRRGVLWRYWCVRCARWRRG